MIRPNNLPTIFCRELLSSPFNIKLKKTPLSTLKDTRIVKRLTHDVNLLTIPYCSVDNSLVNIGVVKTAAAFCSNEQNINQNAALFSTDRVLYFVYNSILNFVPLLHNFSILTSVP